MQNFKAYNKIEISAKIFNIILLGLIIGLDLVSPTTIFIAALLTMPFSFLLAFKHLAQHLKHKIEISATMFKKAIPYGLKAYTGSLIWFLLLRIDLFMINSMQGENFAGLYDVAFNMSEIFYILPGIIGMVLFPKLCAINDVKLKWELARKVGICLIVILVVISIISALVAEFFIVLLFGKAFIASTAIFILLMIGKILISINSIFSYFVASIHVPLSAIPFNMGLLILNVALNFIMIEKYGMQGAAITSIICFGLSVPFHMYYSFKYLRNPHTSIK